MAFPYRKRDYYLENRNVRIEVVHFVKYAHMAIFFNNYSRLKFFLVLFFTFFVTVEVLAQTKFAGRVYDAKTNEPLAFVNIVYNAKNQGTSSDLDGYFSIDDYSKIEFIKASYMGYSTKMLSKSELANKRYLELRLDADVTYLQEITILPGENPAHRIIDSVIVNSSKNNPEKMRSFSYNSYNKMYFTADVPPIPDSISKKNDTTDNLSLSELFSKQHLLLIESVTERNYKYPDNNKETVIAHRMSGMKNPAFTLLATQMQSMSFYKDYITLLDKRFLSPICKGSTSRYYFQIEDTIFNTAMDTIFVISYRPSRGKVFDGLKGVMNINTHGYAIESITAEPATASEVFNVSIQQKYQLIDSVQWFPVQLNTNLIFTALQIGDKNTKDENGKIKYTPVEGIGKTYISDISLNPELKRKDFSNLSLQVEDKAHKQDEEFWNQYRKDSLTAKDIETYRVIDSLGKKVNLDKTIEIVEILANGYIPMFKIFNLDLNKIIWFNEYENVRLGLGLSTNKRLCKWFSVGGYFAYGFRDKAWKYGANAKFNIIPRYDLSLSLSYKRDLVFSDGMTFNKQINLFSAQSLNEWFLEEMDSISEHKIAVDFKILKYLSTHVEYRHFTKNITNTGRYLYNSDIEKCFSASEIGIFLKYAYKEKFFQTPRGAKISLGTNYPILYLNIIKSLPVSSKSKDYYKIEAQIYKHFVIRHVGDTYLTLTGGYIGGTPYYGDLYYGSGSYSWLNIDNSFNTMRTNEFISDYFVAFNFMHNFGNVIVRTKYFRPAIAVATNICWGDSKHVAVAADGDYAKKMNYGYYESGLLLNNLLCLEPYGFGFGVYYRYGPYHRSREIENWAFKLTLSVVL